MRAVVSLAEAARRHGVEEEVLALALGSLEADSGAALERRVVQEGGRPVAVLYREGDVGEALRRWRAREAAGMLGYRGGCGQAQPGGGAGADFSAVGRFSD